MMMKQIVAATAILALPAMAAADPKIKASEIEDHFGKAVYCVDGVCEVPDLGEPRAVCIGTNTDCAAKNAAKEAAADIKAFDLLITFELGSDRLSAQAQENLAEFAKALSGEKLSQTTFNIDGHTDARGSDGFNKTLSERRAAAVVAFLESQGISRDRLTAKGHGESSPRDEDPFAAVNRRVEATLRIQ